MPGLEVGPEGVRIGSPFKIDANLNARFDPPKVASLAQVALALLPFAILLLMFIFS